MMFSVLAYINGLSMTLPPPLNLVVPSVTVLIGHLISTDFGVKQPSSKLVNDRFQESESIKKRFDFIQNRPDLMEFSASFKHVKMMIVRSQGNSDLLFKMLNGNITDRDLIDPTLDEYLKDNIEFNLWKYISDTSVPGSVFKYAIDYSSELLNTNLNIQSSPRKFLTAIWSELYFSLMSLNYRIAAIIEIQKVSTGGEYLFDF